MQETIKNSQNTLAGDWQLYHTVTPRRSVRGPLVVGLVWRQRRDGRWIYMRTDDRVKAAIGLVDAAHRSRQSRRLRKP
jgi:hypothetical protein